MTRFRPHYLLDKIKMANNEESRGLKSLLDWFANRRKSGTTSLERQEREIADGLWHKCSQCGVLAYTKDMAQVLSVWCIGVYKRPKSKSDGLR